MICLALCSHKLGDCFVHFFKSGALRVAVPARHERTRHFFFAKLFSLWLFRQRKKRYKRQTIFRYQDYLAAFLSQNRRKEKLTKETPIRLRGGRHCAWGTTFVKVDETTALVLCEHTAKSQFTNKMPCDFIAGRGY